MRTRFDKQMEELHKELIEMGALCETAIASAVKALLNRDKTLAQKAIKADSQIDVKERDIEALCLKLLLQQQPVASDLRKISSAMKIITDMERIGDQAADISEIAIMIADEGPRDIFSLQEMAKSTIQMVTYSIDAYVESDLDMAHNVMKLDDTVDKLFVKAKDDLIKLIAQNPQKGEFALDLLMVAKYFERIGDHAENIAGWVEFSITGRHLDMED